MWRRALGSRSRGQSQCFSSTIAARAGHDFGPPSHALNHFGDDFFVFGMRKGGRFAGRSDGDDATRPGLNLKLDLFPEAGVIDFAIRERRNDGNR